MTPRPKKTPAEAIQKIRGKRSPKTWKQVAEIIEQRGHFPQGKFNVGYLQQIMEGKRDANNEIRMALNCELKDAPGKPCGKKMPDGTRCILNHGSRRHPKLIDQAAPIKSRVTLDTLRSTHEIAITANSTGVFVNIADDSYGARQFDSWSAAMHWITHDWAQEKTK